MKTKSHKGDWVSIALIPALLALLAHSIITAPTGASCSNQNAIAPTVQS